MEVFLRKKFFIIIYIIIIPIIICYKKPKMVFTIYLSMRKQ